jgi:hypothetical protein
MRLIKERQKLEKVMQDILQPEIQTIKPELQSILIDDMLTVFYNRQTVLKKIQKNRKKSLQKYDSSIPEPKWLTDDVKKIFKYEVSVRKNGIRVTKLTSKKS